MFNIGWLDAEFDEFVGLDDPLTAGEDNLDLSGSEMVNAPDWNISATWVPVELEVLNGVCYIPWSSCHSSPITSREST